MSDQDEELVKIHIALPDDKVVGGESFWAKPLGNDLYEIRNVPFYAYDLHFYDVVRAVPKSPDLKPSILEVVKRSGHKTLRIIFGDITEARKSRVLRKLEKMQAFHEHANGRYYGIDVEPRGDYQAVCDYLWSQEKEGVLEYETGTREESEAE